MRREKPFSRIQPTPTPLTSDPNTDFEDKGRRSLMAVFLLFLIAPLLFFGVDHIRTGHYVYGVTDMLMVVFLLLLIYELHKAKHSFYIYRIAALSLWILLVFWVYTGAFQGYASIWVIVYPLFTSFLLGRKEGAIWSATLLVTTLLLFWNPGRNFNSYDYEFSFTLRHTGSMLLVFLIAAYYEFVREKYKANFEAKQAEIEGHSENLEKMVADRTSEIRQKNKELGNLLADQKKVEAALRESEEKYRTILDNIDEGYYETDLAGNFTFFNQPVSQMLGYSPTETMGKNYREYTSGEESVKLKQAFNRVFTTGEPARAFSQKIIRSDGSMRYAEISASVRRDAAGRPEGFRGIIRDITDRKRAEIKLRQTQKMEALGTLTGGVAHDFNNILSIIMGCTDLLRHEIPKDDPALRMLKIINSASLRARDVVRHLLTFSRKGEESQTAQEIGLIIKEALKMMRSTIGASIEIRQHISGNLPLIMADPTQIHQLIVNLCKNAADAMADGGILSIGLEPVSLGENDIVSHTGLSPGEFLKLTVSDTGHGISAQDMERIFDPYFTTKELDKGTGLGLSVVMGIVKSHRGEIRMKSNVGEGTHVEILFPVAGKMPVPDETTKKVDQQTPGGTERVLFVDDEAAVADLYRTQLKNLGYTVDSRTDPMEALSAFSAQPEAYDLLITDMAMPKITGDRLIREVLKIRPDMGIILCTGFSEKISKESAKSQGIDTYLEKPVDLHTMAVSLRATINAKKKAKTMDRT